MIKVIKYVLYFIVTLVANVCFNSAVYKLLGLEKYEKKEGENA